MLHKTNLTFAEPLVPRTTTQYIILHHSEMSSPHTVEDIHQWHLDKGWAGIGYHYFIAKDGEVYEGRPRNTVGAHTLDHNSDSIGICFEGNFDEEEMTEKQHQVAVKLLAIMLLAYPDAEIRRHCDFTDQKSCPGKNFPFTELRVHVIQLLRERLLAPHTIQPIHHPSSDKYHLFDLPKIIQKLRNNPKKKRLIDIYEIFYGPITEDTVLEDFSFYQDYLLQFDLEHELKGLTLRQDPIQDPDDRIDGNANTSEESTPTPADWELLQRFLFGSFSSDYHFSRSDKPNTYELSLSTQNETQSVEKKIHTIYTAQMERLLEIFFSENLETEAIILEGELAKREKTPEEAEQDVSEAKEVIIRRAELLSLFQTKAREFISDLESDQIISDIDDLLTQ
ncbi:MAG: N-acetylmuramoyl-L-alanine amidase [Bacteroidales bacterium]|nr:N-acetylmuramoyl-L-alanine amidase [Bacteroidales bacterium]